MAAEDWIPDVWDEDYLYDITCKFCGQDECHWALGEGDGGQRWVLVHPGSGVCLKAPGTAVAALDDFPVEPPSWANWAVCR